MKTPGMLITRVFFLLALSISHTTTGSAESSTLPLPVIKQINARVYALIAPAELPNPVNRGYMANSTIIIGDDGVILIDTGFSTEIGRHIRRAIAGITHKPVTHIINTHDHGDHMLGNGAFDNAVIISSEKCREIAGQSAYEWNALLENMTGKKIPYTDPVTATQTFAVNTSTPVRLQGVSMVIQVPGASHSQSDLMVYLPDDRILIAGDILVNALMPNFRDARVRTWIITLKQIVGMSLDVIVPGHGSLMNIADAREMYREMNKLYSGIEAGYNKDLTDSEIRATLDLTAWNKMNHFDDLMGGNISRIYLEVEQANF